MVDVIETYHDRVRTDTLSIIPQNAGRLLDLGGGIGATGAALKALGRAKHVVLADQVANEVADGVDRIYAGDLECPDLISKIIAESGPFDTILCLDILEHLRDPWVILGQLKEGLSPDGHVVISLPNMSHASVIFPLLLQGRFDLVDAGIRDRTHLRWFTRRSIDELIVSSGFTLEVLQSNIYRRSHKFINALTFGLFLRFFTVQYVLRARKSF